MINDALKLTIDSSFPPKKGQTSYEPSQINVFEVDGVDDSENMWISLMNLASDKKDNNKGNRKVFVP